jgi:hypothetical protein
MAACPGGLEAEKRVSRPFEPGSAVGAVNACRLWRGAELFGLCLSVGGLGGRLADFLVGRRVGLLGFGIADWCGLGGAKRLDLLVGMAVA